VYLTFSKLLFANERRSNILSSVLYNLVWHKSRNFYYSKKFMKK